MKRKLHEIEDLLRDGKLPDADTAQLRHLVWQKVLEAQRRRRKPRGFMKLPPWAWALGSILLILLGILAMLFLAK